MARLEEIWQTEGPVAHGFAGYYLSTAREMVARMAGIADAEPPAAEREEWVVPIGGRRLTVRPDRVIKTGSTVRVQRLRTGRKTKSELEKPIYAVLRRGAEIDNPGMNVEVETLYLSTGERVAIPSKADTKNLSTYQAAIASIEAGDFGLDNVDRRHCPNCPYYFRCTG